MKLEFNSSAEELKIPIPLTYDPSIEGGRTFIVAETINVVLSNGQRIVIEKGFKTDLASIPQCLWSLLTPIDEGFIGDLIHDYLWVNKQEQLKYFNYNIYNTRKFADDERNRWRTKLSPKRKLKNWVTHTFLRLLGGLWYSRQLKIPS